MLRWLFLRVQNIVDQGGYWKPATTLVNKKINFLQVNGSTLKVEATLNVDVDVMGIASQGKNLVVSYDHPGVKIISKEGVLWAHA